MQLNISAERSIEEVQREFTSVFPFLKIEFFSNGLVRQQCYPAHLKLAPHTMLKNAWKWKKDLGVLEISENMTVLELENAFMDQFGLSVQVFRKSGNVWLETTMTDHWTLKQQTDHGREIAKGSGKTVQSTDDYDLNRDAGH